jgi:hypothetical protein
VYVVIRFWKPYIETGYTTLIHGLIHILYYIRITIIFYTIIIMTLRHGRFIRCCSSGARGGGGGGGEGGVEEEEEEEEEEEVRL